MHGAYPLTRTLIEARSQSGWWTTPANTKTPYTLLQQFC